MRGRKLAGKQIRLRWLVRGGLLLTLLSLAALIAPAAGATPSRADQAQASAQAQSPTVALAQGSAGLTHSPIGHMDITFDTINHVAHTSTFVDGMPQNGVGVALVVRGDCNSIGGVLWRGVPMQADANGKIVDFRIKFEHVQGAPIGSTVVIQTIAGTGEPRDGYNLACGKIVSTLASGPEVKGGVIFGPAPSEKNGNVTGHATLTENNGALTVNYNVSGLEPNTAHAAAIHLGNCTWRSYVLYDLPQLNADGNGNASNSITINNAQPLPTTSEQSWYIAVDYNPTLNRDSFLSVSCGDVVVAVPR
jgi:Cu/Zn superoxide dismutase